MKTYSDSNGKVCSKCEEYKPWKDSKGRSNFNHYSNQCRDCRNLYQRNYHRQHKGTITSPSTPLETNIRTSRWVCKIHADIPSNHYLNYRGHRVCRRCHFDSIIKANRERRRRQNNWKPLKRSTYLKRLRSRRKTERLKRKAAREQQKRAKKQQSSPNPRGDIPED